jgi:hypothetical protein
MKFLGGLTENLGIKFTALFLAVALYFHVVTEQPVEQVLYFPVQVEGLAESLAMHTPPPQLLGVKVRGTGKQILRLRIVRPAVMLDLSGVAVGQFQRTMTTADFQGVTAEGVDVTGPSIPARIELTLEPRGEAEVPVAVRLRGDPARGFILDGPPETTPARVRVSGPRSWVRARDSVETEPISVAGKRGDIETVVPLVPPPTWATATPGSVLVSISIGSENGGSRDVDVEIVGLRPGFRARPDPGSVRVTWMAARKGSGDPSRDLTAIVDANSRGRGRYRLPVEIRGAGAPRIRRVEPDSVSIVIP